MFALSNDSRKVHVSRWPAPLFLFEVICHVPRHFRITTSTETYAAAKAIAVDVCKADPAGGRQSGGIGIADGRHDEQQRKVDCCEGAKTASSSKSSSAKTAAKQLARARPASFYCSERIHLPTVKKMGSNGQLGILDDERFKLITARHVLVFLGDAGFRRFE